MSKLKINRVLTAKLSAFNQDPYAGIQFKTAKSSIKNIDGSSVMTTDDIVVPAHWSDIAVDVLARNYLRKRGVPLHLKKVKEAGIYEWLERSVPDTNAVVFVAEKDSRQLFNRLAGAWTYWGVKGGYFDTEEDARNYYDEMRYMLAMQMGAPNSPQWFNTGIHWAYGIEGDAQGHYYFDEATQSLQKSTSAYERPQPHACFIQSVRDDLVNDGGIMDLWKNEARLFKFGSGTGTNFSNIRAAGEPLSGGGHSSGIMSFLRIGDVAGGSIKSGGTTRRAAKMVILNIDHPDIEAFINWKTREEDKVVDLVVGSKTIKKHLNAIIDNYENKASLKIAVEKARSDDIPESYIARVLALLRQGFKVDKTEFTLDWNSEGYYSVFGQNSNNSVRVNDEFVHAVEADGDFSLTWRGDGKVAKTLKARYLWDLIAKAAWSCADPGVQFDTTINAWHTCAGDGRINASNPCSEYMFLDDTACNLASMNLISFLVHQCDAIFFDTQLFKHATRLWVITLEISVYMAQFPTPAIAQKSYEYRTLGLGYGNLGAFLMQSGIPYDSPQARHTAAGITALMQGIAYETSAEMAQCLGAFTRFAANKESMMRVIHNHTVAASHMANPGGYVELSIEPQAFEQQYCVLRNLAVDIEETWKRVQEKGLQYGFRNAQVSVIAPTGTIGLIMDFKTTGIEPQFSQIAIKQLAGGGVWKMVNSDISKALEMLGYSDAEIAEIEKYVVGYATLDGPIELNHDWLYSKGFVLNDINRIENTLKSAFNITQAFQYHALSPEFFERHNISANEYNSPDFNLLKKLGASEKQIEEANLYCCGHMTIEGAPSLQPEHIDIFDCAVPCGKGVRYLSYESHIRMMAAVQPFISGAISKTINLPTDATVKDCEDAYMLAWRLGLKSVALYRDNSKYSQVLSTGTKKELEKISNVKDSTIKKEPIEINITETIEVQPSFMQTMFKPFRRRGYTQHVLIGGSSLWHTTGENENGKLSNLLLTYGKEGSTLRGWASAWGRIFSMYLQERGDSALIRVYKAFRHSKFEPMGDVQGHAQIKYASSIPDYIVEDLVEAYPDMLNASLTASSLPPQRNAKVNKIKIGQETMYIIIGEDGYGRPAEFFVAGIGNEGSDLRGWMSSCAKLISLYFQDCGDSAVWQFINAFEGSSFDPAGFVEGHPFIKFATSPLDFLAKHLKLQYSHVLSNEQTNLLGQEMLETNVAPEINMVHDAIELKIRSASGYKADEPCKNCRAFKLRYNGTCYICDNCFITTGCS